jgi:hypothetical protein
MQLGGVFGPGQTLAELEASLADAGLVKITVSRIGALAYFSARRRGGSRAGTATRCRGRDRLGSNTQLAPHDTMRRARDGRRDV